MGKSPTFWGSLLTMRLSSMDLMRSVRSERDLINPLTKPLAMRLVSETSRGVGLIPKLWHHDGYPTFVIGDPMNEVKWVEVISDPCEGTVSFYGFPLSRWGDLWWVHPYSVRQCKLQGDWGWALALNGSIVPTCWDEVFLHALLMDATDEVAEWYRMSFRLLMGP